MTHTVAQLRNSVGVKTGWTRDAHFEPPSMADLLQERITLCVLHPKKIFFYFQVKKFTHNKPEGWTKCEAPTDSFWAQAIRHFSCTSIAEMKGASKHLHTRST